MTGRICLACWEFCLFHEQSPYKTALPLGFNLGGFCMITSEPCFTQGSIRAAGKKSKGSGFVKRITSPFKSKAVFFFLIVRFIAASRKAFQLHRQQLVYVCCRAKASFIFLQPFPSCASKIFQLVPPSSCRSSPIAI